ncbi:hypothetical protein D9615_009717 [Tricholomella constricta]|uniref:Uncharacterized protein n=1 Tax=Tricholomella constricta TaxID=117010 RepID=A0A8H5GSR1_9AGAR|nr:hypothetical protein D9615_009717 [Tricholomella constricta]
MEIRDVLLLSPRVPATPLMYSLDGRFTYTLLTQRLTAAQGVINAVAATQLLGYDKSRDEAKPPGHGDVVEENPPPADLAVATIVNASSRRSVRFENVTVGYHADRPIFRNLSFTVPAGKEVAISVLPGAESLPSSAFSAKPRLHRRPKPFTTSRWTASTTASASPLFYSDILHDIKYGRLGATDEEVREAAWKANVHNTVMGLRRIMIVQAFRTFSAGAPDSDA